MSGRDSADDIRIHSWNKKDVEQNFNILCHAFQDIGYIFGNKQKTKKKTEPSNENSDDTYSESI